MEFDELLHQHWNGKDHWRWLALIEHDFEIFLIVSLEHFYLVCARIVLFCFLDTMDEKKILKYFNPLCGRALCFTVCNVHKYHGCCWRHKGELSPIIITGPKVLRELSGGTCELKSDHEHHGCRHQRRAAGGGKPSYRGLTGEDEHAWQSPGACRSTQRRPRRRLQVSSY